MDKVDAAYVTLALVPGIGHARLRSLLARFETADEILGARLSELRAVPGMTRAAASAVVNARLTEGERAIARAEELGGTALVPTDRRFPSFLREISDPPPLLFVTGTLDYLNRPGIAIIGTRDHTSYGAQVCRKLSTGAARAGLNVVSGMARGIDAIAHEGALDAGGVTVGVLGNGLGVVYPAANRKLYERVSAEGCLVTEFPPGERPNAGSFPRRNRLISGLCKVTLVIEAGVKSGALITADCALNQGREVVAVPGPITSKVSVGCNRLIQMGAKPVLSVADVLEEFGLEVSPIAPLPNLPDDERIVYDALDSGPLHIDDLVKVVQTATAQLLSAVTSLEVRGLITQQPGKMFVRT